MTFDPAGLRNACGLTQAQVAEAIGVSRTLLGFYETGERQLPADVAARLRSLFGVRDSANDLPTAAPSLLLRSNKDELNALGRAELHILDGVLELYVDLLDHFGYPACALTESPFAGVASRVDKSEAERAARRVRTHMSGKFDSFADPLEAINGSVMVFQLRMGADIETAPSGFFFKHPRAGLAIAVNADLTLGRQHFSAAHELAHALFHSHSHSGIVSLPRPSHRVDGRERFANQFAVEFLMPADDVVAAVERFPRWASSAPVEQRVLLVQREFSVSFASAAYRLRNLGFLDAAELAFVLKVSPRSVAHALGWSPSQLDSTVTLPDRLAGFPSCLQWLLSEGINSGVVSAGDVAETAAVSTESVRRMMQPAETDVVENLSYEHYAIA